MKVDGIAKPTAKFTAPVDFEHEHEHGHRFAEYEFDQAYTRQLECADPQYYPTTADGDD